MELVRLDRGRSLAIDTEEIPDTFRSGGMLLRALERSRREQGQQAPQCGYSSIGARLEALRECWSEQDFFEG